MNKQNILETQPHRNFLSFFSLGASLFALFLLFAGAMVTSTHSGLSVPDWPLSYGKFFPPMIGGVFYEHGHRLIALGMTITTLLLVFFIMKYEKRKKVLWLSYFLLIFIFFQALLGGLTVLLRLPTIISISHALVAQTYFAFLILLATTLQPSWFRFKKSTQTTFPYRTENLKLLSLSKPMLIVSILLVICFYIQLLFGATTRHLKAGLVISDFPTVFGGFLPPVWTKEIFFHFMHRNMGYLLCILVLFSNLIFTLYYKKFMTRFIETYPHHPFKNKNAVSKIFLYINTPLFILTCLIGVQILLGALVIWLQTPPTLTSLHLVNGALCLMLSIIFLTRWTSFTIILQNTLEGPTPS